MTYFSMTFNSRFSLLDVPVSNSSDTPPNRTMQKSFGRKFQVSKLSRTSQLSVSEELQVKKKKSRRMV